MNRRTLLSSGVVAAASAFLAGCSVTSPPPVSERRDLELLFPAASRIESGWKLSVDVIATGGQFETIFHEVRLFVYSEDGDLIGRKNIGYLDTQLHIEVFCSAFPHLLVLDARESPCEEHVNIEVREYQGRDSDGEREWNTRPRKCGEKLPHLKSNTSGGGQ